MKAGRNDPCPCGSGKKYKKCCLTKDQEATSKQASASLSPETTHTQAVMPITPKRDVPVPPPDPIYERGSALFKKFKSQSGEARIAIFHEALDDEEVMTDDLASEMLDNLRSDAVASGDRLRFAKCVDAYRERRPEEYAKGALYYLSSLLEDALVEGRQEDVPILARQLAELAESNIDIFNPALERLRYHGQLSVIVEALRIAWPSVKISRNIMGWGIAAFAERGVIHEIYDYLDHTATPDPDEPQLLERIKFYVEEPQASLVRNLIDDLTGQLNRTWQMEELTLRPPVKKKRSEWGDDDDEKEPPPDPGALNLSRLIDEFVGYAHRVEGVPFPRADMIREELSSYFAHRHAGDLDPRPSMFEAALNPKKKLPKPPPPAHPLCPERVTLDGHLASMMGMFSVRYHSAAALFQAMPAWLRFLETRRLIDTKTREKVAAELLPLHRTLLTIWKSNTEDSTLYRDAQTWPMDALKAPSEPAP